MKIGRRLCFSDLSVFIYGRSRWCFVMLFCFYVVVLLCCSGVVVLWYVVVGRVVSGE